MITTVEATNIRGELLLLELDDVAGGYAVESIEGLDPVNAILVSSGFAQLNGEYFQSSRRDPRDIALKLSLEPDYLTDTVGGLRKRLYRHFMPESPVGLRFTDSDGLVVDIDGRVESCAAPPFTAEPRMDVSVRCFNPDFRAISLTTLAGATVATEAETLIAYDGTLETGLEFTMNVDRSITEFSIYHRAPDGSQRILEFAAPMVAGDVLKIGTNPGNKGATLTHSGSTNNVLYGIAPQSNWLQLEPGDNYIRVYATGAPIPWSIDYVSKYGGL